MKDHSRDQRRSVGGRRDELGWRFGTGAQVMLVLGMLLCFATTLVILDVPPALILAITAGLCGLAGRLVYRGGSDPDDARDDGLDGDPRGHAGNGVAEPEEPDGIATRPSSRA